jgi:hypothetical protein
MSNESKCNCQYCNGHIAFPAKMAGQSINCPHCHLETLLFIPTKLSAKPKPQTAAITIVIMLAATIGFIIWKQSKAQPPAEPAPRPTPNIAPQPAPIPEPAINHDADDAKKLIAERVQSATDHYNSAGEVFYRKNLETEEHFQHLEMMNHIQRGDSDLELEIIKLRHQEKILSMQAAHATTEAEWQRQEDEYFKKLQNLRKGVKPAFGL